MSKEVAGVLDSMRDDMVQLLCNLISIPAISPDSGGRGEAEKAAFLSQQIRALGLGFPERFDASDPRAEGGLRPNIAVRMPGRSAERLWIVTHMDVVPEGDRSLWETDPFVPVVRDGKVYGRGSNDNGQEIVASIFAAYAIKRLNLTPAREICLCFVADEEMGSRYGIQYLLKNGLFAPQDLVVVPDGGTEKGDFIEVAEKSILWFNVKVFGRQVHASKPHEGLNACRVANELSVDLDRALHKAFPDQDKLFEPSISTFEPTKREANVANVNTVPGKEVFAFDCRILPGVPLDDVLRVIGETCRRKAEESAALIELDILQRNDAAPPTSADAPVVKLLNKAVSDVLSVNPLIGGIGGGTCAAFFRSQGIPAAVWAQEADVAHMPNEYAVIEHIVNEAKVFAYMMLSDL
ncbi:MAG TPA: M20 family metallo-hydrolase [Acetomicrobium flavidum]|uniref:Succinyl-diaminopimelate desuccinylase n=1 Tax=Acetomicrobium flavidum TaxID=49896 RepID=A0ABY1JCC4_9BACT|nr:succinyl-diaminopimelate desuccinylase [Acetomicrobium flavidum]HOM30481.1 M20 family metallo-hydrolase [Acetomicrobium flavidum]HOP87742.1 M20 family metallo-hydrolase [Acetomicrobium flavidum]HPP13658.1 M20 family metallo-hydrolase [Acetomicrobium flavidum]HPU68478.1 M20 family metallo-hydrolase [Acetomicrobium flavidum]